MTRLVAVTRDHVLPIIALTPRPDQAGMVTSNAISLAQAPFETGTHSFGIWDGERLVGFAQIIVLADCQHRQPGDDPTGAFLWRFMIDAPAQGRGHGRAALALLIDWARVRGCTSLALTVVPSNTAAIRLYTALGLRPTGQVDEGEDEYRLPLSP